MAGFAFNHPNTENERFDLRTMLNQVAEMRKTAIRLGLYIDGQTADAFFGQLQRALEKGLDD